MAFGWPGKGHGVLLKNSYAHPDPGSGPTHRIWGFFGASGARFVVTFGSAPTFPTGCPLLASVSSRARVHDGGYARQSLFKYPWHSRKRTVSAMPSGRLSKPSFF